MFATYSRNNLPDLLHVHNTCRLHWQSVIHFGFCMIQAALVEGLDSFGKRTSGERDTGEQNHRTTNCTKNFHRALGPSTTGFQMLSFYLCMMREPIQTSQAQGNCLRLNNSAWRRMLTCNDVLHKLKSNFPTVASRVFSTSCTASTICH